MNKIYSNQDNKNSLGNYRRTIKSDQKSFEIITNNRQFSFRLFNKIWVFIKTYVFIFILILVYILFMTLKYFSL